MVKRGLIQVYTGDGKGKTTAALGLAIRARGHGLKVAYIYFHKDPKRWGYGEHRILKKIGVDTFGFANRHPHFYPAAQHRALKGADRRGGMSHQGKGETAGAYSPSGLHKKLNSGKIRKECLKGLKFIESLYKKKKYNMIILDEINISLRDGFLKKEELLNILNSKPRGLELVLTGRGAIKEVIECADLVSKVEKVKHPYDSGIPRRIGIEY